MNTKTQKLYRIWDIRYNKYYSTGKKSIWKSLSWASNALDNIINDSPSYLKNQPTVSDYDIHIIEQTIVESIPGRVAVENHKNSKVKNKEAKKFEDEINRQISVTAGDIPLHIIELLYAKNKLSLKMMETLTPLFIKRHKNHLNIS